jgi:hypothetical protein
LGRLDFFASFFHQGKNDERKQTIASCFNWIQHPRLPIYLPQAWPTGYSP